MNHEATNYDLTGKRIAILVADGFEQVELTEPRKALEAAGAKTEIVSPADGQVQGWNHDEIADLFDPDQLRMLTRAVEFVDGFFAARKPVAAICHAPWTLIEAEMVKGRRLTSWPSLKTDLINAGAEWVDREVVVDHGLVTSRKPADIPAFNQKMIEEFSEERYTRRRAA